MRLRTETPGWVRRAHGRVRAALLAAGVALLFLAALPGAAEEPLFEFEGRLIASPFAFERVGQSGRWVSEIFPHFKKVTYRYGGRDFRLTDGYGRVIDRILT